MSVQLGSRTTKGRDHAGVDGAARPATLTDPDASHTRGLSQRVTRVAAKARLEAELRSIACDLLGPNESDEFPAACAEWLATTTDETVSRVSDAALEALVRGLDSVVIAAPAEVTRRLDRAKARAEAGFD